MHNKKKLIIVLSFLLISFIFIPSIVGADSGWDSDYGSSSSSDYGSYDSDSSSSYGGSNSLTSDYLLVSFGLIFSTILYIRIIILIFNKVTEEKDLDEDKRSKLCNRIVLVLLLLRAIFFILVGLFISWLFSTIVMCDFLFLLVVVSLLFEGYMSERTNFSSNNNYTYTVDYVDISNEVLINYNLNISILKNELYNIFVNIQFAWMNFDYDKLKDLCTDELYNSYKSDLEILKLKNGQNIMSDFNLNDIRIYQIDEDSDNIIVEVYMNVTFYDYVINTKNNKVIRGSKDRLITNNYLMTFVKGKNESDVVICPNCGKETYINTRSECEYCHSVIVKKANRFVLSKKSNLKTEVK